MSQWWVPRVRDDAWHGRGVQDFKRTIAQLECIAVLRFNDAFGWDGDHFAIEASHRFLAINLGGTRPKF